MMLKLLRWANIALVFVTLLCYLSPYISPASFWPFAFFGLLFPWLLLAHLIFIAIWGSMRRYQLLLSLACLLVGWPHVTGFVGLNLPPRNSEQPLLQVKSFNAYSFRLPDISGKRHKPADLPSLFPLGDIDILCLQEYPAIKQNNPYTAYFKGEAGLKYVHTIPGASLAIFSRHPIVKGEHHFFVKQFNGYQWADIKVEGHTYRVYNLHLQSNAVSSMASEVATEGDLQSRETWLNIRGMAGRFKRSSTKRAAQAEQVAQDIAKSPHPVIVCGDFNAVPQSYAYRQLSKGLHDTFRQAGTGLGTTYGGTIPALRIDYILYDPAIELWDCDVEKEQFSDHYSVTAAFRLSD
jgi:endonuclease/exonuclease/phosphatase family metal-dependent hydrolase